MAAALDWSELGIVPARTGPFRRAAAGMLQWCAVVLASLGRDGAARTHDRADPALRAAFRAQILPHLDAAYTLARFLARDATSAEDIVQEAYLRAFRGFARFRGANPRAWILAIVRNCHRDWRTGRGLPLASLDDEEGVERVEALTDGATPEGDLLDRSRAQEVRAVLSDLPEAFREVLVLRELEDLSYREIAEVAAIPIGTVMSRLARARQLFAAAWTARAGAGDPP
ncbi:MAG: sigma-70 family RNA polymerase sigma factor [Geminicoccaceae bacterium]